MNTTSLVSVVGDLTSERKSQIDIEKKQIALVQGTISTTAYAGQLARELNAAQTRRVVLDLAGEKTVADFTELKRLYGKAEGFTESQMDEAFSLKCSKYIETHGFKAESQIVVAKAWHAAKAKLVWMAVAQTYDFLVLNGQIKRPKDYVSAYVELEVPMMTKKAS